ncbi:type II toxin-antitoxin system RelE/ParE family toxin [Telmatospirillum siberiense]|uniref:Type II toxin-antitoxin system mRNA interferase toxin, RelE/StbE family n=1 Tax=Telmatospirillum siberiense TaxID=382514 RepID=A0A2N3PS15_9PROT|nr:type II toxin-antitoxin system RelE/ParE family toxin [Telmatospirillum siberiense]PKU23192.1 type II toxin-antitoxin system mRNA interferase toxin, RelE/StbE family [Telmatospirillum siberiense]
MKVRWTPEAEQDRYSVVEYIAANNPRAAIKMDELFGDSVAMLADFPLMGRVGIIPGTRELILHESYRVVYEVEEETVWVLALVHTARQWPPIH